MNDPTKTSELALLLQSNAVRVELNSLLLLEHVLQLETSSRIGRIGSKNVHTRNDCGDERKAEEKERMAVKFSPVISAQAVLIRPGSELLRLEYRHNGYLQKNGNTVDEIFNFSRYL